jgi:chemotaxis protein CheY-P-specific phosphatase CheC
MESLNPKQQKLAETIITVGLEKAAESLSFFMKENIRINEIALRINTVQPPFDFTTKIDQNIHFLITEVIGELKGVCCLIFSEQEADELRKTALPKEILDDPNMMKEMSDAIMLEVDNIISASVITQFSNILNNKIYGGVPQLKKFTVEQLNQHVKTNYGNDLFILDFKARFTSNKFNFQPEFVWLFDSSFLNSVKQLSEEKPVELLEKI